MTARSATARPAGSLWEERMAEDKTSVGMEAKMRSGTDAERHHFIRSHSRSRSRAYLVPTISLREGNQGLEPLHSRRSRIAGRDRERELDHGRPS